MELVTKPLFMSNYTFTGALDKLPQCRSNFTTGEKRLVTALRYSL